MIILTIISGFLAFVQLPLDPVLPPYKDAQVIVNGGGYVAPELMD